jgi:hypothetical protein
MKVVHFSVLGCFEQSTGRSGFMPGYFPEKHHTNQTQNSCLKSVYPWG